MSDTFLPDEDASGVAPGGEDSPDLLRRARAWNLLGLATPAANLGMLLVAPRRLRWFGLGAGIALCGGAAVAAARRQGTTACTLLAAHLGLALLGIAGPRIVEFPARAWFAFGRIAGRVGIRISLTLVYFVVVTPLALAVRLLSGDPLLRRAPPADSYWKARRPSARERMERQF